MRYALTTNEGGGVAKIGYTPLGMVGKYRGNYRNRLYSGRLTALPLCCFKVAYGSRGGGGMMRLCIFAKVT